MDNEIVRTKITNVIDFETSIIKSEWEKICRCIADKVNKTVRNLGYKNSYFLCSPIYKTMIYDEFVTKDDVIMEMIVQYKQN